MLMHNLTLPYTTHDKFGIPVTITAIDSVYVHGTYGYSQRPFKIIIKESNKGYYFIPAKGSSVIYFKEKIQRPKPYKNKKEIR